MKLLRWKAGDDRISGQKGSRARQNPGIMRRPAQPALLGLALLAAVTPPAASDEPLNLKIIGGLAGVTQFTKIEAPFWTTEIETLSKGKIRASIHAFDRAGLPGGEMLRLIQNGVVPFGTSLLQLSMGDAAELGALDLPTMNPEISSLRRSVSAFRPYLTERLREHYNIELLGIYTYPAQVVFCAKPFSRLADLSGQKVRTSSVMISEIVTALGGIPVKTPFAEVVPAVRKGVVDCAITGTMSGNEIGLSEVTSHIYPTALAWGISVFAANRQVWNDLKPEEQAMLREAAAILEKRIWESAEHETANGLACNSGQPACIGGKLGKMVIVPPHPEERETLRKLAVEVALPRWLDRCGESCVDIWNRTMSSSLGFFIAPDRKIQIRDGGTN